MAAAGFNVIADNCDAACFFQQRLPALDYDLAMYINTASPDPDGHRRSWRAIQVPSEENGNQGQNSTGWCNEEASAIMNEADQTLDEGAARRPRAPDRRLPRRGFGHAPAVPVPEHRRMAHRQA